ncbi:MAG: Lrp/AsnC family transcriptional regulator [Nanoarchaeota archaeon]
MNHKNEEISGNFKIDKKDIEIIRSLEKNARTSILNLAKKVKLSHETVRYRINKLVKSGVIENFTVSVDKRKLGYEIYAVIMISTWNYTEEQWKNFLDYLVNNKNITAIEKITGNYDLKIAFWAKDSDEFDNITQTIKTKFSSMIKEWQTFIFTKLIKWGELPF